MTESVGRPAYQQVADDLRRRIASAEFPVGSAIPSTTKLTKTYGVSITVVRAAVTQLRVDGLLVGQPGKGVFVRATPDTVAERAATVDDLSKQVEDLRAELHRMESSRRDEVAEELALLRRHLRLIQAHLMDLYAHFGMPYDAESLALPPSVEPPADDHVGERPPT